MFSIKDNSTHFLLIRFCKIMMRMKPWKAGYIVKIKIFQV